MVYDFGVRFIMLLYFIMMVSNYGMYLTYLILLGYSKKLEKHAYINFNSVSTSVDNMLQPSSKRRWYKFILICNIDSPIGNCLCTFYFIFCLSLPYVLHLFLFCKPNVLMLTPIVIYLNLCDLK